MTTRHVDHAEGNARRWLAEIVEMTMALDNAEGDTDEAQERIQESVLSVQVRGGWHNVGDTTSDDEFEILLSTGGPALRLHGSLDAHNSPVDVKLEKQDWFTPWSAVNLTWDEQQAVDTFAAQFYFGE